MEFHLLVALLALGACVLFALVSTYSQKTKAIVCFCVFLSLVIWLLFSGAFGSIPRR